MSEPDPVLLSPSEMAESQTLTPDLFSLIRRGADGRFAAGHSGNPKGRPRGIPTPRRRVVGLVGRWVSAAAVADLVRRKPDLLRRLVARALPRAGPWGRDIG